MVLLVLEEIRKNRNFNVNQWLDKLLADSQAEPSENGSLQNVVSQLSTEVEEAIAECNTNIVSCSSRLVNDLPKVARELELTRKEIQRLEEGVRLGLSEVQTVQNKTTSSMTTLEKLDSMKTKVVATSQALQEADKWTSLAKQIEQLLDSGDVNKSYDCILGMEKSLSVLNKAQAEERRLILEEMKNRLEALATKHLVLAFDTSSIENSKYFFTMFVNLDRIPQYIKYLQTSEKLKLSQEWRKFVETLTFKEATTQFYDTILDHLRTKVAWCKQIFAEEESVNAVNVLVDLYTETFRSLEPSPLFCFDSETKKQPFIDILIQFNQATDRFVQNIKILVQSQGTLDTGKVESLLKACFSPFLSQYDRYAKYHEIQIFNKVQAATAATIAATTSNESASILQERIDGSRRLLPEIILHIKEGEEKVKIFNRGFGYLHFGKGLNSGLERFISWNQDIYRFMEKSLDSYNQTQPRNALENVLAFTENCGEVLRQIVKLDQTLSGNCARVFGTMRKGGSGADGSPWEDFWGYYLNNQLRVEILQFVQKKETLLGRAVAQIKKLCRDSTQLVLRVTAEPIQGQLGKGFVVADSSLKEAIPSEYITQMGEYLMLLPQNLEPFIVSENSAISYAFDQTSDEVGRAPVDFILLSLAGMICNLYTDRILKITSLTDGQAKQLAQDIDYLASVLEDLGTKLNPDLLEISKLLKNYGNLADMADKVSPRIMNAIRRMKSPLQT